MRVLQEILLWLIAYAVAAFAAAVVLIVSIFGIELIDNASHGRALVGDLPPPVWFVCLIAFLWTWTSILTAPFAFILAGIPESAGIRPAKIRYTVFGVFTVWTMLGVLFATLGGPNGKIFDTIWIISTVTLAGATGGFVLGYLRLGPLRSIAARANP